MARKMGTTFIMERLSACCMENPETIFAETMTDKAEILPGLSEDLQLQGKGFPFSLQQTSSVFCNIIITSSVLYLVPVRTS